MSLFDENLIPNNSFANNLLKAVGVSDTSDVQGFLGNVVGKNLNHAIQKNLSGGSQNPNVVPVQGATQSSMPSLLGNQVVSDYGKWIVGGALVVGLYFVLRSRK